MGEKMKKNVIFTAAIFFFSLNIYAQETAVNIIETRHYRIEIQPGVKIGAEVLAAELEQRFTHFNSVFRFEVSSLKAPLNVKIFSDEYALGSYIAEKTGLRRNGPLYIHYENAENRELVVCLTNNDEAEFSHQAFVQFLRGFTANPPAWMLEGFALFFQTMEIHGENLYYRNYSSLLETAKIPEQSAVPVSGILEYNTEPRSASQQRLFQIKSWAFVSFLLESGTGDYYRTLTDSFMLLSPDADEEANTMAVKRHFEMWDSQKTMDSDFNIFLYSLKTFNEYLEDGIKAYQTGDFEAAAQNLLPAILLKNDHYAPYYYLGLIFYERENYEIAEIYYKSSFEYGADEVLVYYALGLNAAAAGNSNDAAEWFRRASEADAQRYGRRSEEMLRNLESY